MVVPVGREEYDDPPTLVVHLVRQVGIRTGTEVGFDWPGRMQFRLERSHAAENIEIEKDTDISTTGPAGSGEGP